MFNVTQPRTEERAIRADKKSKIAAEKKEASGSSKLQASEEQENVGGMDTATEQAYFEQVVDSRDSGITMFSQMNISRPFLRAIEAMGYVSPTPIQCGVIPSAMAGRDVCASAVTGSGKTAAFVLPFLERLLYRPKEVAAIRVLVVTPTRELASQIYAVLKQMTQFTDITCVQICGGKKDVRSQEVVLRQRPDVIVCTPGRLVDHLRNSHSVSLDDLDVLVLDEVDRLLALGFQEEVEELVKHCPKSRQTMLFSATMTPNVEDLVKLSLKRPIRIKTDGGPNSLAPRLVQEFLKVRSSDEVHAILMSLVCRSFGKHCIVFVEKKVDAHRISALLQLEGVKVSELHGDLHQAERYSSLQKFRDGSTDVLVATDVAARGLDIPGVLTVINAEMPRTVSTYIHRVGRTARAGCGGRSITLVSDDRRKVMKEVLKGEGAKLSADGGQVLSRTIPAPVLLFYQQEIKRLEPELEEFFNKERINKRFDAMQEEAERAENMLLHQDEITARPARTWYQTETQKKTIKEASRQMAKAEEEVAAHVDTKIRSAADLLAQKARAAALADDYRLDENNKKDKKPHQMTRKKRRRLEALEESRAYDVEQKERAETAEAEGRPLNEHIHKHKKEALAAAAKMERNKEKSAGELAMKRVTIKDDDSRSHQKVVRQKFAVGGLDQDLYAWGSSSSVVAKAPSRKQQKEREKEFTEFDPNKRLKKGGKIGKSSFKSKGKFKRRK